MIKNYTVNKKVQAKPSFLKGLLSLVAFLMILGSVIFTMWTLGVKIAEVISPHKTYTSSTVFMERFFDLVNTKRKEAGCEPVSKSDALELAAYDRAKYLGSFENITVSAHKGWVETLSKYYNFKSAGENLAQGYDNQEAAFNALMSSDSHRANILDCEFTQMGVARWGNITVQLFATPVLNDNN